MGCLIVCFKAGCYVCICVTIDATFICKINLILSMCHIYTVYIAMNMYSVTLQYYLGWVWAITVKEMIKALVTQTW